MGVDTVSVTVQQGLISHDENKVETGRKVEEESKQGLTDHDEYKVETRREVEVDSSGTYTHALSLDPLVDLTESKISWRSRWRCRAPIERLHSPGWTQWEAKTGPTPRPSEPSHDSTTPNSSDPELFSKLKQEHDLAKAVKSDDAEVPVDLWDQAVCRAPPSEVKKNALNVLRDFMLLRYRRQLWMDARKYLQFTHDNDWCHSRHAKVLKDITAVHDILWRAASNNWFDYSLGSRLIFFHFPARYRTEAKRGVKVFFASKGLSS